MTTVTIVPSAVAQVPVLDGPTWTLTGIMRAINNEDAGVTLLPLAVSTFVLDPMAAAAPRFFSGVVPLSTVAIATGPTGMSVITMTFPMTVHGPTAGPCCTGCGPVVRLPLLGKAAGALAAEQFQAFCNERGDDAWPADLTSYDPTRAVSTLAFSGFKLSGGCGLYTAEGA